MKNVGHIIPIPDGENIKVRTVMGPMQMTGEGLANPGEGENALVVMGPLTITTPVEKVGYSQLVVMGPIVAPKGSEAALSSGITTLFGPLQFYPTGPNIKVHIGDLKMSGKTLAAPTDADRDTLVVVGDLFITTSPEKVGYKNVIVKGDALAPKESEDVLGPYLEVDGNTIWYASPPREFNGQDRFSAAFFELLKEPITMILNGQFTIESDVTVELLREKVTEIILNGQLEGPKHLVPLLQVLATVKNGTIEVAGEGGGERVVQQIQQ
jgi:hypothetical protein